MTQDEKLELVLEWAEDKPFFDKGFVEALHYHFEKYGTLTQKQEDALDSIIDKFGIE